MTVSGLGSSRTPHLPVTPPPRAVRAEQHTAQRNDFDQLTPADRELIFHVTGQRLGLGFDPAREGTTGFAAVLAAERAAGRLLPGQEATVVFLKDRHQRYERGGAANPITPYLGKAVEYLSRGGARGFDVTA